jgi:predicted Rossmann fold nucleotide-binding protein DprA/Smf involved in DNA uptake
VNNDTNIRPYGDPSPQDRRTLALFCSVKCPGKLILDAYETCRQLRETDITVTSGFHSPMEQECLRILLRGTNPVIWCLARGTLSRTPPTFAEAVAAGRLTILAPFPTNVRRVTAATCAKRNRIVADMVAAVLIVHAATGSKIESFALSLLSAHKPLYTFDHPANAALLAAGAKPITADTNWNLTRNRT